MSKMGCSKTCILRDHILYASCSVALSRTLTRLVDNIAPFNSFTTKQLP